MILLTVGAEMLARLMRADGEGEGDSAWLLHGPTEVAVEPEHEAIDWPLAAE